jgi:hypothetical protein
MLIAMVSVTVSDLVDPGHRESGVVAFAIPVTLALTMATFYFYGYTLNRITLFALIFSIGILVDDAIVVVENIVRHNHLPENEARRRDSRWPSKPWTRWAILPFWPPDGDRRHPAHGLRRRAHGALHAADSGRGLRGHGLLSHGGLYRHALGGLCECSNPTAAVPTPPATTTPIGRLEHAALPQRHGPAAAQSFLAVVFPDRVSPSCCWPAPWWASVWSG